MADQKISELTAAASATAAHEYAVNESNVSKKVTGAQIQALTANPSSDDGDGLGTAALRWSDLFLAEGGVINWDDGDAKITQTGNELTVEGAGVKFAAGESGMAPVKLQSGTLLTTPEDGAIEMDANCIYGTTDAGNRGYIPVRHFIRCNATRTLPNDTAENAIFNDPTNGRLTLETGTYLFEGLISVSSMSATSGNALLDILGAGTAVCNDWLWHAVGADGNANTAATQSGSTTNSQQSAASIVSAGTGTSLHVNVKGTFTVTTAGTIIPSIDLVTAAAAIVAIGSYMCFERIGATDVVSVGQWD